MAASPPDAGSALDLPPGASLDVAAYLNTRFPTADSLSAGLPAFTRDVHGALARLDAHISALVREERYASERAAADAAAAAADVAATRSSLAALSSAAADAGAAVAAALADAAPLDRARRNVAAAADALIALSSWHRAVGAAEAAVAGAQGAEGVVAAFESSAPLWAAADAGRRAFAGNTTGRVKDLRARSDALCSTVVDALRVEFRTASDSLPVPGSTGGTAGGAVPPAGATAAAGMLGSGWEPPAAARLRRVCAVADQMGEAPRVASWYVDGRVRAFEAAFSMASAGAAGSRTVDGLGGMGARLAWLRRELRSSSAARPRPGGPAVTADTSRPLLPQVMPAAWRLPRRVARAVMGDIREWVRSELSRAAAPELPAAVVEVMVAAVQDVAAFEEELDRRFALEVAAAGSRQAQGGGGANLGAAGAPATVDGQPGGGTSGDVEALLAHCRDGTPLPGVDVSPSSARVNANGGPATAAAATTPSPTAATGGAPVSPDDDDLDGTFVGLVSGAFEPYLGAFVAVEASRLRRVVAASVRAESWAPAGAGGVAASATELFLFIKKSLHTAAALSLRQPLFDLIQVFRAVLREYAGELVRHLPAQPASGGGGGSGSGGGSAFSAGPLASTSAAALASSFSLVSTPSSSGSRSVRLVGCTLALPWPWPAVVLGSIVFCLSVAQREWYGGLLMLCGCMLRMCEWPLPWP